jgi:putative cell wall-binding protein
MSGTSMAAANASGVAALAASARPSLLGNGAALRTHLIGTARALPAAQGLLAYPRLLDARAAVVSRPDIRRVAGADRYETAAAISRAVYPPNTPYVFIAVGTNFPDALAGGALAARAGAPMLLVKGSLIPPATAAELARLAPYRIFVLGSAGVIPDSVASQLAGYQSGGGVTRIAGPDRYATAANVAAWFPPDVPVAYVATGRNFPDALSGVPAAELNGGPLLLVTESRISAETQAALSYLKPKKIIILGSAGVVGSGVAAALDAYTTGPVLRQAGPDRYATASEISKGTFSTAETVFIATGRNFPDALGGGTAAAAFDGPLLLVPATSVPPPIETEIRRLAPARVFVLGTAPVVSDDVVTTIRGFFP